MDFGHTAQFLTILNETMQVYYIHSEFLNERDCVEYLFLTIYHCYHSAVCPEQYAKMDRHTEHMHKGVWCWKLKSNITNSKDYTAVTACFVQSISLVVFKYLKWNQANMLQNHWRYYSSSGMHSSERYEKKLHIYISWTYSTCRYKNLVLKTNFWQNWDFFRQPF